MKILLLFCAIVLTCQAIAQSTISDARKQQEGETVTVSGIVINGDELGTIKYLQDSTAGIAIYDTQLSNAQRGDSITVTGELDIYNNLLEIKNVSSFVTHASGRQLPAPKVLTISEIGEDYEGQLIQINNIEIEGGGGTFSSNANYDFTDGSQTGELRISSYSSLVGEAIPSGEINMVAICSQFSYTTNDTQTGYQILPRDMDDFISENAVSITSSLTATEISNESLTLSWQTDVEATSEIRYGYTFDAAALTNNLQGNSTVLEENIEHQVEITGLQAAEIIYAQAFSVSGTDTAFSSITAFVTESNSTGTMHIYFNSEIDESLATETIARNIGDAMEDTLAAYINNAEESIDLSIYNFNNSIIRNALNTACDRGVKIRIITCGTTSHYSINDLDSDIAVLERPEVSDGGIMHNKFAIIDGNSGNANKAWVWSGSTNLTQDQLYTDANNMVFIQDQSLARSYEVEFEEMWGGTGDLPDASNAKFGEDKTDNTPHQLIIGGNKVECYFSPSDDTNQKLINAIETANNDLSVQTMLITRSDLAYAIVNAYESGAKVHVITDSEDDNSETVDGILSSQLPSGKYIFDDTGEGMLHHKMAIIDANDSESDPQVITGSHNWSNAANDENDENTLIIHNADIANQCLQQFAYRFEENDGDLALAVSLIETTTSKIYPNPTTGQLSISSEETIQSLLIYSLKGEKMFEIQPEEKSTTLNISNYPPGIYLLIVLSENQTISTCKIVKN